MENQNEVPLPYQFSSQQVAPPPPPPQQQSSQYNYQAGRQSQHQTQLYQRRYGAGVKPKKDGYCGCSKKTCIVIIVVAIVIVILVLALIGVGIYYAVEASNKKASTPEKQERLRCVCNSVSDPECKITHWTSNSGTILCKKGQECYGKDVARSNQKTLGCRDPGNYTCYVDQGAGTTECWCSTNECVRYVTTCLDQCAKGTKPKPKP